MYYDRKFQWDSNEFGFIKIEFTQNLTTARNADQVVDFTEELSNVHQLRTFRDLKYMCITCNYQFKTPIDMEIAKIVDEFLKKINRNQKAHMFLTQRKAILADPYMRKCHIWNQ